MVYVKKSPFCFSLCSKFSSVKCAEQDYAYLLENVSTKLALMHRFTIKKKNKFPFNYNETGEIKFPFNCYTRTLHY